MLDDFLTGEWDEALQLAKEGLQLCDAHGYDLEVWPFHHATALVAAGRGDHATTWALTDQCCNGPAAEGSFWALRRSVTRGRSPHLGWVTSRGPTNARPW